VLAKLGEFPVRGLAILAVSVVMGVTVIGLVGITLMSGSNPTQKPLQVIKDNMTVTGKMAFVVTCNVFAASCPPDCCTSVFNIQLINYQGNYYYVRNVMLPYGPGPATTITSTQAGGHVVTTISLGQMESNLPVTIWFTNSTVYCISPSVGPQGNNWGVSAPSCP
jgi:hypothetical protein